MNVLLLGDGNFSFSLALATFLFDECDSKETASSFLDLNGANVHTLYCTSFDSKEELYRKYPEFAAIEKRLSRFSNVVLKHQVNAWEIPLSFPTLRFDRIVWNHPHLGGSLLRFF